MGGMVCAPNSACDVATVSGLPGQEIWTSCAMLWGVVVVTVVVVVCVVVVVTVVDVVTVVVVDAVVVVVVAVVVVVLGLHA